ncbi:MAG: methylated-DNA--[protein]-cysteine S-methyltransferase [Flammeovirgaceae bacterium]|nr:methylated-DNA--[protein]-cysteine S-methyltransferase [Flammeovirgaceae bacterium]
MVLKTYFRSPLGVAEMQADEEKIFSLKFLDDTSTPDDFENNDLAKSFPLQNGVRQLQEYFQGQRRHFDLPIRLIGTTFQQRVWEELTKIPFGKTITYAQLATQLGDKKMTRAVASANSMNPLWIIVPCHRVVGSDQTLVGYAGGLWRKEWLLKHEQRFAEKPSQGKLF